MSRLPCLAALALLPLVAALGVATSTPVIVATAHAAGSADGTRCEIRVYKRGSGTTVEGVVMASAPISGAFRLSVNGAGSGGSDNDQSGSFSATPGGATSLGSLSVGSGSYAVEMTVHWKGGSTSCAQHVGKS